MHLKESNEINQRSGKPDIWGKIKRIGVVYPKKEHLVEGMITIFKIVDSYSKDGRKNQLFTFMVDWKKKKKAGGRDLNCQKGDSGLVAGKKKKKK